jgi:beta-lactamase regulating signal transducer with metallopeptidase domain
MISLHAWLESPLVLRLGGVIFHSLWQVVAIVFVLALALPALRRRGPRGAYTACCLALVCCLLLPVMTFLMSSDTPAPRCESPATLASTAGESPSVDDQRLDFPTETNMAPSRSTSVPALEPTSFKERVAKFVPKANTLIVEWAPWLVVVWASGVVLLSTWNFTAWLFVLRLKSAATFPATRQIEEAAVRLARQLGLTRTVRLLQSVLVESPLVIGAWKPVILLPAALVLEITPDQLEALLAHELAHVFRQDYLVNLLQTVLETLLFYHPGAWWISAQVRREREHCCDDLALGLTSNPTIYVQALAAVAGARTRLMAPAANGGQLIPRLHRILGITRSESGHPAHWLAAVVMLSLCGMAGAFWTMPTETAAAGAESTKSEVPRPPAQTVNMVCVDADGKPIADAEVYLFQYSGAVSRYVQFGPLKSDEQGKAVCFEAIFSKNPDNYDRWIYARIPGRLVGVARTAKWTNRETFNPEFQVKLQASGSVQGMVTVPAGFDCTKVTVRVKTVHVRTGPGMFEFQSFPREDTFPGLDTALPAIFDCHPDSAGQIRFDDVPIRGAVYLVTAAEGLGEAQWRNNLETADKPIRLIDQPIELALQKESALSGRVLAPDGRPVADMEVAARLAPAGAQVFYLSTFRAVTSENGGFQIHGLPQKNFVLSIRDPKQRWTLRPLENLLIQPAENRRLTLTMETGVLVGGRVLDAEGKPVADAAISAVTDGQNGTGLGDDSTNAAGRYQFRIPSGKAHLYFNSLPDGFVYPDPQIVKDLDIQPGQADIGNLDFVLQRKAEAAGKAQTPALPEQPAADDKNDRTPKDGPYR